MTVNDGFSPDGGFVDTCRDRTAVSVAGAVFFGRQGACFSNR